MPRQLRTPDGIYTVRNGMQPTARQPVLDGPAAQSKVKKLPTRNHAVLVADQTPNALPFRRSID
jgi:hypothetical protein